MAAKKEEVVWVERAPSINKIDRNFAIQKLKSGSVAPCMVGVFRAIRDFGCQGIIVYQSKSPKPFVATQNAPTIVLLADDVCHPIGTAGFHSESLENFIATCYLIVVTTYDPIVGLYNSAAKYGAQYRKNSLIAETKPEMLSEWLSYFRRIKHNASIQVSFPWDGAF